jgi:hypothetical protein
MTCRGFRSGRHMLRRHTERARSIRSVSDGQATTISRVTGWNEAQMRSWAITGTSAALLVIQYACLWFYGFLRQQRVRFCTLQTNSVR